MVGGGLVGGRHGTYGKYVLRYIAFIHSHSSGTSVTFLFAQNHEEATKTIGRI